VAEFLEANFGVCYFSFLSFSLEDVHIHAQLHVEVDFVFEKGKQRERVIVTCYSFSSFS
jgi:hypothetical protein